MKNIITYTKETFDTFETRPFCSVDSLILSTLSYIHFPDVLPEIEGWKGMTLQQLYRAEFFEDFPLWKRTKRSLTPGTVFLYSRRSLYVL